jgi:predicted O-methyltransferase YrrM
MSSGSCSPAGERRPPQDIPIRGIPVSVIRAAIKRAVAASVRTTPGKHVLHAATAPDRVAERFGDVPHWPATAGGFEDLDFLFTSSQLDHGVASLRFDEAALLYRLVRDAGTATIAEIGRFKGGSTLLMATAMAAGSTLWSYDLHVPARPDLIGADLDAELAEALKRLGVEDGVHLVVGDSRVVDIPRGPLDVLFIDGDHSYEGARADFERWASHVREGGHLLFHDAVDTGGYGNVYPGVQRAVAEVSRGGVFVAARGAGTIAHFVCERAGDEP